MFVESEEVGKDLSRVPQTREGVYDGNGGVFSKFLEVQSIL